MFVVVVDYVMPQEPFVFVYSKLRYKRLSARHIELTSLFGALIIKC